MIKLYKFVGLGLLCFLFIIFLDTNKVSAAAISDICKAGHLPSDPAPGGFTYVNQQSCTDFSGCQDTAKYLAASLDTANKLASALGAQVGTSDPGAHVAGSISYTLPIYTLVFPNGYAPEAGYMAQLYDIGSIQSGFDKPLVDSICGSGTGATSGGGSGGTTSGGSSGGNGNTATLGVTDQLKLITTTFNQTCNNNNLVNPTIDGNSVSGSSANITSLCSSVGGIISSVQNILNAAATNNASIVANNASTNTAASSNVKTVTVDLLNVRTAANTSAPVVSKFTKGQTFVANGSVDGENIEGVGKWWIETIHNYYVWSGGTTR